MAHFPNLTPRDLAARLQSIKDELDGLVVDWSLSHKLLLSPEEAESTRALVTEIQQTAQSLTMEIDATATMTSAPQSTTDT